VTSEGVLGSYGAIVGSLSTGRHTSLGPSEGSLLIKVEESEFLLKSEPYFFIVVPLECSSGCLFVLKWSKVK
jgi:hypothetical protein